MDSQKMSYNAGQAKGQADVCLHNFVLSIVSKFYQLFWKTLLTIAYNMLLFVWQEKASNLMDKAREAAQSAKESMQEVLDLNHAMFGLWKR